ncbi:MAG: hypothetical protein J6P60_00275 [Lachnospiraceae bacterium]|nr:hypothetical protein [Lachnospiraceae bacterium]
MILILMFAFLTVFLYHWKANEEDPFEAFARSILTFAVLVLGITNFLSLFKWCTRVGIFVSWTLAIFVFGTVYVARFGMTLPDLKKFFANIKKSIRNRTWIEYIMLGLCLILCVILFVGALFTVPANYDSMTYHLGRIGHWIDQRSVNHFVTDIDRQLYSPVLAEYYLLHMMLLSGSDTFVNFLQYVSMLFCAAFIYRNARLLGTSRTFSMFGAFLFLTMPLTISQSVTTQNDLFAASIFAMFLYYFLWFIRRPQLIFDRIELENLIRIGILVGLAFITKTSVCASMLMFMPWLIIVRIRRRDRFPSLIKSAVTALFSMLVIISESLVRNYLSSGKIMPETASSNIMVATKNVSYIIVNILKNLALLTTQHLSDALNGFMCRVAIHTGALLHVQVNHEAISFHGFDFIVHMNRGDNMYSHDITPSAYVTYLALVCGVILLIYIPYHLIRSKISPQKGQAQGISSGDPALSIGFGISAWLSLGFIMALLRWQPWGTRLMFPALAMMTIVIANLLGRCFSNVDGHMTMGLLLFLIAAGCVLSYPSITYNMEPALANLEDGCSHRTERYFEHNKRYETYQQLIDYVKTIPQSESPFVLGVNISGDGYDYPLWLMFRGQMPKARLAHLRFDAPEMVPDAPEILLWVEKEELQIGETVSYGEETYQCVFVTSTDYKDAVLILQR